MSIDASKPVFGGLRTAKAQTSLRIPSVWSAPLLFAYWKVSYLNLLQPKFQFLARLFSWAGLNEHDLVGNPKNRFCRTETHVHLPQPPMFTGKTVRTCKLIPTRRQISAILPANALASSVDTIRRCSKSDLLPISITTMSFLARVLSSSNQCSTFSYVCGFVMSYTNKAPFAPL